MRGASISADRRFGDVSDADYERVVAITSREMSSDYEMSRILRAVAAKSSLANDAMRRYISAPSSG